MKGKVNVKAVEEFFDRTNQVNRPKDSEFVLKAEVAKQYEKDGLVEMAEPKEKKTVKRGVAKNTKAGPRGKV
jgi:hypothetical protein